MMKKLVWLCLVICISCVLNSFTYFAHPTQPKHWEELEAMLFDNREYKKQFNQHDSEDKKTLIKIWTLEYGQTICIDQFGETDQMLLRGLHNYGVHGIPKNVSEINPKKNNEKVPQLSGKNHHTYTHQGWDFDYTKTEYGDIAKWPIRKNVLLASVETVFDFSTFSGKILGINVGYTEKCNSFSALLYYLHVLGDYWEAENAQQFNGGKGVNGNMIPFASSTPSSTPDLISEIIKHLEIIFADQKTESPRQYNDLISDIQKIGEDARSISGNPDGTIMQEQYEKMIYNVRELMKILIGEGDHKNYIHQMLLREDFFTDAFYPNE